MIKRSRKFKISGHMVTSNIPVIATIVTDEKGFNAKIRGNYRYGDYFAPNGKYYYKIFNKISNKKKLPLSFEDLIVPIGFKLPKDKYGNLIKGSINLDKKEII